MSQWAMMLLVAVLSAVAATTAGYATYVRFVNRYTRERFAFVALGASTSLVFLATSAVAWGTPWEALLHVYNHVAGANIRIPSSHPAEKILVVLLVGYTIHLLHGMFVNWNGAISQRQYEYEKVHEHRALIAEGLFELRRLLRQEVLQRRDAVDPARYIRALESPADSLAWRDEARELIELRWPEYALHPEEDWHASCSCWIGRHRRSKAPVALLCRHTPPSHENLDAFIRSAASASVADERLPMLIVAIQEGGRPSTIEISGRTLTLETRQSLLDALVDFSDYFADIERRATFEPLPDSELTFDDVYVPSRIHIESSEDGLVLERYLDGWLEDRTQRQLALLGDYGQGKSTSALLYARTLIRRTSPGTRIPLLLELRGKSPSTLEPLEFLGAWCSRYRLEPRAIMRLIRSGRILLIFEGFDEMAQVSDFESRLANFRSLWRFCYPSAKILITGRPNFFLDESELRAALGTREAGGAGPYCQAIYLESFDLPQMSSALRWMPEDGRAGILTLAGKDVKFRELVSRPSILYIVGRLWDEPELREHHDRINSAVVIDLFIRHTQRRQTEKHRDGRSFMLLTEAEREYFMTGISAYMVQQELQNQITGTEFESLVQKLYETLPDSISRNASALLGESPAPLKQRLRDRHDAIDAVATDVRTYGLLVSDESRAGALRFAHKSFAEFLFGKLVAETILKRNVEATAAVRAATGVRTDSITGSPQAVVFMGEIASGAFEKQPLYSERGLVKQLSGAFVGRWFGVLPLWAQRCMLYEIDLPGSARAAFCRPSVLSLAGAFMITTLVYIPRLNGSASIQWAQDVTLPVILLSSILAALQWILQRLSIGKRVGMWFLALSRLGVGTETVREMYGERASRALHFFVDRSGFVAALRSRR